MLKKLKWLILGFFKILKVQYHEYGSVAEILEEYAESVKNLNGSPEKRKPQKKETNEKNPVQ